MSSELVSNHHELLKIVIDKNNAFITIYLVTVRLA